ncbi:hypothetical protein FDJ28_gp60 [Pseudomonas phage Bjorn]|uniref:Uncharacterized protein n=1 Tax=Pseudomonas phage Bjorn TaxID=2079288 RepID=A0A2K9VHG5_9CAUD|nr:hypothetical protein FDJ28_gp60 [Pseudomonas phage Bjorn]AUV61806.1 hypothetical protein PsPhBjorn_gp10 [Pseudomonas phage Bjorn]
MAKVKRTNNQIAWIWMKWMVIVLVIIAVIVMFTCWSVTALNPGDWHPMARFGALAGWVIVSAFCAGFELCDE